MNKSEYKEKRDNVNKYRIEYNKYATAEQYIEYLASTLVPPLNNMQDMEGEMYMSDFVKLRNALWLITNRLD
tara:strand:- start:1089 stop:1304 length:216 start_codon:yes stop_codon:yes gene_type:complete